MSNSTVLESEASRAKPAYGRAITIMVISGLSAITLLLVSVISSWSSLPFMGDEPNASPAQLMTHNLVLAGIINFYAYWRFKKLNKEWARVGGSKAVLWTYQSLFIIVIAVANVMALAVVKFYLFRDSA